MLSDIFKSEKISAYGALPLSACTVLRERYFKDFFEGELFCVMLIVPYPAQRRVGAKFASFAVIPDYHIFFKRLEERILPYFSKKYPGRRFRIFSDVSPIDERDAACRAGLGVMGDNGLFIAKGQGSFVFIGEMVTDLTSAELEGEGIGCGTFEPSGCLHCGKCAKACPAGCIGGDKSFCVSALTQKKGVLTDTECDIIKKSGYAWGCDVCALVCPLFDDGDRDINSYFTETVLHVKGFETVDVMDGETYSRYAFSWRKKDVIKRNFDILGENREDNGITEGK